MESLQHSSPPVLARPALARAVEIAAMLGDSVVGVAHCTDPRGGRVSRATWAFLGGGLACLLAAAIAFFVAVDTAARNAAALEHHVRVRKAPAQLFRPELRGALTDLVGFGGLALGLAALTVGLARARSERRGKCDYRIGTAPGVNLAIEGAPAESFPLVAPAGDGFVFQRGPGIDGELLVDGAPTPLGELAGAIPIPERGRIRARLGRATFFISAVEAPSQRAIAPVLLRDGATLKYAAGSLAAHLALVLLLSQVALDGGGANVELGATERLSSKVRIEASEDAAPAPDKSGGDRDGESAAEHAKPMALDASKGGAANSDAARQVKNRAVDPQLAREEAIEAARTAGLLGTHKLRDSIHDLSQHTFDSGFDPDSRNGVVDGSGIHGRGTFGTSGSCIDPGTGCAWAHSGTVGTSRYGTIQSGKYAGDDYSVGTGTGKLRTHSTLDPCPGGSCIPPPRSVSDGLDRTIVKRYIKRQQAQIAYCYEKELLARPDLAGTVTATFLIGPTGAVQSSQASGLDEGVASCVAGVIRNIQFPAPGQGGTVTVNYPFIFRATGR